MTKVTWSAAAHDDLAEMRNYYRSFSPSYAHRVTASALKAAGILAEHPRLGPALGGGTRKWNLRGSDYIIIYRIVSDGIEIIRVRNAMENWWGESWPPE